MRPATGPLVAMPKADSLCSIRVLRILTGRRHSPDAAKRVRSSKSASFLRSMSPTPRFSAWIVLVPFRGRQNLAHVHGDHFAKVLHIAWEHAPLVPEDVSRLPHRFAPVC